MKFLSEIQNFISSLEISCKFLILICVICLPVIALSIFNPYLDANGNLVTIRTLFSSIIGYILEKSTNSECVDKKSYKNKTLIVGILALTCTIIILLSYIFNSNINNPSLIMIKNLAFSAIGYLTSASNSKFCKNK